MSVWSPYYKVPDKSNAHGFALRRYRKVDGKTKWERYPAKELRGLSADEVDSLLRRLNSSHAAKVAERDKEFAYQLAYINPHSMEKFEEYLSGQINDQGTMVSALTFLKQYGFKFFINKMKLNDPALWHTKSAEWGTWLLATDLKAESIQKVIATVNRFNRFIQEQVYPEMPAARKLAPIGRKKFELRAKNQTTNKSKFINDEKWAKIVKWFENNDPEVLPNVQLTEAFGLRLSESLGISKAKFFKDYLLVDLQGDRIVNGKVTTKPVKTIDQRQVPYWYISAKQAWALVQAIVPMHPDTLNDRVNVGFHAFGHTSHHMRRRFITRAFRDKRNPRDIQLAAGHQNILTTMAYAEDDREMADLMAELD